MQRGVVLARRLLRTLISTYSFRLVHNLIHRQRFADDWMLPEQLKEFEQTLIAILGLSSYFFFCWKDDGYFTQLTELNPLVHTWSSAVEEQFDFIFPLVCYFLRDKKRYLLVLLLTGTLFSCGLAQGGDNLQPTPTDRIVVGFSSLACAQCFSASISHELSIH